MENKIYLKKHEENIWQEIKEADLPKWEPYVPNEKDFKAMLNRPTFKPYPGVWVVSKPEYDFLFPNQAFIRKMN